MRVRDGTICVKAAVACGAALTPAPLLAHTSEQGFVLLLPTGVYTVAGVAVVALTVLALFAVPDSAIRRVFGWRPLRAMNPAHVQVVTSLLSLAALAGAVWLGFNGPRDPLSNLMPLGFWTLGWMALVTLSGVFGNLGRWINPWSGLYRVLGAPTPLMRLPEGLGLWPAVLLLTGFASYLLAGIAPDDPARLARLVAIYWAATFAGLLVFGQCWLRQAELGHAILATYARLAPVRLVAPAGVGGPGWQVIARPMPRAGGIFALTLLAAGSFDGINESFWWMGLIGINPLEFPGRSAVVVPTLVGLGVAIAGLAAIFAATVWLGLRLAHAEVPFARAFGWLALSLLPIALVYHVAHYLTAFLVNIQYTVAALSDPLARGHDWLGIEPFRVTTGFFNQIASVRIIWLTQAGLVVLGHVWSVLLSHRIALDLFGGGRRAALATLPLSVFMILYTCLGLWLLAAPRGA